MKEIPFLCLEKLCFKGDFAINELTENLPKYENRCLGETREIGGLFLQKTIITHNFIMDKYRKHGVVMSLGRANLITITLYHFALQNQ